MKLVKKCLIAFNNQRTNKITKKEVDNDVELRFTLLDMQKFAKHYHKQKLTLTDVSQQRELLKAYAELIQGSYTHHFFDDAVEESIDKFLSL